jgi:hypothetical protein
LDALTGAAIGTGAKVLIDKITGKPTVVPNTGAKPGATSGTGATSGGTKNPAGGTKPAAGGVAPKGPTSVVKPPVSGGTPLTDEEIQAELDKAKALEGDGAPPEGAVDLGDGTFSVTENGMVTVYDAQGNIISMEAAPDDAAVTSEVTENTTGGTGITRSLTGSGGSGSNTVSEGTAPEYFQDEEGNIYLANADGGYDLVAYADGTSVDGMTLEDNSYVEPDYPTEEDAIVAENTDGIDYPDYIDGSEKTSFADNSYDDYDSYDFAKRGGLITMMKNGGGVQGYADGGGIEYYDDGSYTQTFDDGSTITVDSDGNVYSTTDGVQTTIDDDGNYTVTDGYGVRTVYDPTGNVIPTGGGRAGASYIANVGSGAPKASNVLTDLQKYFGISDETAGKIKDYLPAAGAGAFIASLLGSNTGGGGGLNQGVDMSQVGAINPRTTDFGIGPSNFVGYDQYGTEDGEYTPNAELLKNLNAPGYNPVNPGDYGYEEVPEEDVSAEEPAMASGGLSSMSTPVASYYTFGQPADIMANLGMRPQPPMNPPDMMTQISQQKPPMQSQQQSPQQMLPQMGQQAPQGMPQPMRRGGLPHVSNVPMTQGRMDFRRGAAVHGEGDGQSDDIPAMLADGEYVLDAELVAQIGNGSTKAGAQALDKFRENIRAHKRSAPINKIPPKTKALTSYLKGAR